MKQLIVLILTSFQLINATITKSQSVESYVGTWQGKIIDGTGPEKITSPLRIVFEKYEQKLGVHILTGEIIYFKPGSGEMGFRAPIDAIYTQEKGQIKIALFSNYNNIQSNVGIKGIFDLAILKDESSTKLEGPLIHPLGKKAKVDNKIVMSVSSIVPKYTFDKEGNAVKSNILDYGTIDEFKEGFATYRKGEQFGIIDSKGNELIPLGKFDLDMGNSNGFHNGLCAVRDVNTGLSGFIDTTGKLVVPCTFRTASYYQTDNYAYVQQVDENKNNYYSFFLDKKGRRYATTENERSALATLFFTKKTNYNTDITTFYRKNGTKAFETNLMTHSYGDGMYKAERQINGIWSKTGFMDTSGRLVIPFKFAGEIGEFNEGLALYSPKFQDDYQYAFINKVGEEAFRLKNTSYIKSFDEIKPFENGYANFKARLVNVAAKEALITKKGSVIIIEEEFKKANPQIIADLSSFWSQNFSFDYIDRCKIGIIINCGVGLVPNSPTARIFTSGKLSTTGGIGRPETTYISRGMGLIDYDGKILIPPIFKTIGKFDDKSGLAKAELATGDTAVKQGFINTKGEFVFVLRDYKKDF